MAKIKKIINHSKNNVTSFNQLLYSKTVLTNRNYSTLKFVCDIAGSVSRSAYCYNFKAGASTWMRIFAQLYPDGGFWEDVKDSQQYYR